MKAIGHVHRWLMSQKCLIPPLSTAVHVNVILPTKIQARLDVCMPAMNKHQIKNHLDFVMTVTNPLWHKNKTRDQEWTQTDPGQYCIFIIRQSTLKKEHHLHLDAGLATEI